LTITEVSGNLPFMLPKNYKYELPDLHVWLVKHALVEHEKSNITCSLDDHRMALDFYKMPKDMREKLPSLKELMSKHQLIVSGPMGKISAIQGGISFGDIEIYCIEGDIFDDIRRYSSVEAAGKTRF